MHRCSIACRESKAAHSACNTYDSMTASCSTGVLTAPLLACMLAGRPRQHSRSHPSRACCVWCTRLRWSRAGLRGEVRALGGRIGARQSSDKQGCFPHTSSRQTGSAHWFGEPPGWRAWGRDQGKVHAVDLWCIRLRWSRAGLREVRSARSELITVTQGLGRV